MLYQPTFPSPYLETIDATNPAGNVFKCLINPKNKVVGYEITVLSNIDNSPVCKIKGYLEDEVETEKQVQKKSYSINNGTPWTEFENVPDEDSVLPIVGSFTDESWLKVVIPSSDIINLGLTNDNEFKWSITLYEEKPSIKVSTETFYDNYNNANKHRLSKTNRIENTPLYIKYKNIVRQITNVSNANSSYTLITLDSAFDSVIEGDSCEILSRTLTSYDYYFKTRKTPVLTFDVPDSINSLSYVFSANITRESDVYESNISSYKFELYLGADIIDTSENVYSNDITYTYNGFISGNGYIIKLTVITEDDETLTEERDFKVSYNVSASTLFIESEVQKSVNGIYLNFDGQVAINGYLEGGQDVAYSKHKNLNSDMSETNNSIVLSAGQTLYWDSINDTRDLFIPNDGTTMIHWHGTLGYVGKIIELSNTKALNEKITVGYDSKSFYYKIGTNDMVYYSPYENGVANAIAGRDDYSTCGRIVSYTVTDGVVQVEVVPSNIIQEGMYISINGERKKILAVSEDKTMLTLESAFEVSSTTDGNFFIYDELRCYVFSDEDILTDNDIFVENDMGYNYWWLIVIMQNEVKFIRTQRYTDTIVKAVNE